MANYYYDLPDDILEMIETQVKKMMEAKPGLLNIIAVLNAIPAKKLVEYLKENNLKKSRGGVTNNFTKRTIIFQHLTGVEPWKNVGVHYYLPYFSSGTVKTN